MPHKALREQAFRGFRAVNLAGVNLAAAAVRGGSYRF